ncbi:MULTISPECIES: non-heme iron oxygenase ferredoxin subunit [Paraburkholderia]|uniref:Naphthalene 1,2-dioxygenase system ferredoxin subunit n=2 Tax=Paraburkholderia TaxID=1822464 RepID=A0A7Z7B875_9BURK|nr:MULTISPECIES: non-heme iron oxygenase ferredoxin subunit [Paraburkholderia]AUT65534.1 non-heme iron oxygenase ferredoxin subunit [Paraburkholderia terrae]BCZ82809.1 ferredoxin [Paraburkholderia terrae]BDC43891.1 ferredoxin [Paraburkholderia terrae]SDH87077.1 naphthalene 1,2-dioxygenase system ferredoxin subunit [Paraburkholderia steynii]
MTEGWIDVAAQADLPDNDVIAVKAGGREIALYSVDGEVYATDNICTHGHARLCDGFLEGGEIECPLHQGRFDVRTGKAMCAPLTDDLRSFPVRIVDARVIVQID